MQIKTLQNKFVPAQKANSQKLIIVLHGLGDSFEGYTWLPEELNLPDFNYLMLNAPDSYYEGFSWYNLDSHDQGKDIHRSRKLLFEVLEELKNQSWQTENIVLFGFSQGCVMSLDLALNYQGLFAGICGISGYLYPQKKASEFATEQNVLITYGKYDQMVRPEITQASIASLKSLGLQVQEHQFAKEHTIDFIEEFPLIKSWIKQLQ